MSDQLETQVEQPIEQVEEASKPKRTRGPNKKTCKAADPNYFKDFFLLIRPSRIYILKKM